jgi:hypothetical protein
MGPRQSATRQWGAPVTIHFGVAKPHETLEGHCWVELAGQKKPFVRPILTRHATLPKVTAAFFGTFSPGNRPQ